MAKPKKKEETDQDIAEDSRRARPTRAYFPDTGKTVEASDAAEAHKIVKKEDKKSNQEDDE